MWNGSSLFDYFSVFGAEFSSVICLKPWNPLKYVGSSWVLEIIVAKKWWNFDLFFQIFLQNYWNFEVCGQFMGKKVLKFWHFAFISKISGNVTEISYFLGFLGFFRDFLGYVGKKVRKIAISSKFRVTLKCRNQWKPMETNGNQWKPMETNGNQWKPIETSKKLVFSFK